MPISPPSQKVYQRYVRILAALVVVWAVMVLLAHLGGVRALEALGPGYQAMSIWAACLMLALGLALFLSRERGWGSGVAMALGGFAFLVSLRVVGGAVLGPRMPQLPGAWMAGDYLKAKISPLTAASALGLVLAMGLVAAWPGDRWSRRQAGAITAMGPLGLCLVVLVSYAAGAPLLYGTQSTPMTLPAAGMGVLLSLAVLLAAGVDTWPLALFGARAVRAPSLRFGRVRWGPLGIFLVLALGILAGGIYILKGQLKTARLIVQDELSAIAELKAGQITDWYYMRGKDAARMVNGTVIPGQPSAETLVVGRDQGDAVFLSERLHPGEAVQGLRVPMAANPDTLPVLAAQGREGLFRGADYRGRPVVAALKRVHGTPWVLMTKVDEADVYGPMRQRAWTTGLLILGLIALVAMGIGLVVRHQDAGRILDQLALERERKLLAERSDHLMRNANDMIVLSDLEGRILESNVAASEHFGFSPEAFRAMRVRDLRLPEHTPQVLARFQALKAAGSGRFESSFRKRDGSEFPAEVSARVISLGEESFVLHFMRDITERKAAEAALRASEEKFSKAFATSPDAIAINRLEDGVYVAINPGFTRMTGYTPDEVLGRSSRPEDRHIWADNRDRERLVADLREHGEVLALEAAFQAKDGRRIDGLMSAALLDLGDERCVISITRDITQRKQAEEEHRQLEARLHQSQKLDSLGSLAGGVAHDMNNVLGAILSLASARREGLDPADPMASALDTIATACVRGRGVVRSLLYFVRKDLEETRTLDLNTLVRDMVQLLGYTTLKRIDLEMDLQEPLNPVLGDGGALSHALMNLCVNALDAMPVKGRLRLRTENLADGRVRVAVQDTGAGMTEAVLAKAVEPFYTTKPQGQGTGLGLAMVFGTMQAHGGSLEILSQPGQGTEVTLTFPVPAAAPAVLAGHPGTPRTAQGGPLNILVVDDDELIRESLVPMLEILGHGAQSAPGGMEALALFQDGLDVDLVILDMNMPGINGAETLARIKALRPGQVVLMSSGFNDTEVNGLVSGYPGVHCIQKPFSMNELRRKLEGIPIG
jgi:PAS domain S-box-containing protein